MASPTRKKIAAAVVGAAVVAGATLIGVLRGGNGPAVLPSPSSSASPSPGEIYPFPGNFFVRCTYSHTLPDDPIVHPGVPGASHTHDFYGNIGTNAFSTAASLQGGTSTCGKDDPSGYWHPAFALNGVAVTPLFVLAYWDRSQFDQVEIPPVGMGIVGGNSKATGVQSLSVIEWNCGGGKGYFSPYRQTPYDCRPYVNAGHGDGVQLNVTFPDCWDGLVPAGPNWTADLAYDAAGICPVGFPHQLPQIIVRIHTGIVNPLNPDGTMALQVATLDAEGKQAWGPFYTAHSDYFDGWNRIFFDNLIVTCLNAHKNCGLKH